MKKFTVTIGIPAYNEEATIDRVIHSIALQKGQSFVLKQVIIINDGSTDKTTQKVGDLKKNYKWIKLIDDGRRLGKTRRLNQLHTLNTNNILIYLDADTILGNNESLENLTKQFRDTKVVVVSGNKKPIEGRNLIEKLINTCFEYFYHVRKELKSGNNVYNLASCYTGILGSFAKDFSYPKRLLSHSEFLYFLVLSKKLRFVFAKKAIVYYRSPTTLSEYYSQLKRCPNDENYYSKIFERRTNHYKIPWRLKIKAVLYMLIKKPLLMPTAFFFQQLVLVGSRNIQSEKKAFWDIAVSTKQPIELSEGRI